MARFIIRFYNADNTQCEEMVVTGRKLSGKEISQIGGEYRPGEELYYISRKNEYRLQWIIRYKGNLAFASRTAPRHHYYKIVEA